MERLGVFLLPLGWDASSSQGSQHEQTRSIATVESRFLEPPRVTKIGLRNREFEKSKVASNDTKLPRYCFTRGNQCTFL